MNFLKTNLASLKQTNFLFSRKRSNKKIEKNVEQIDENIWRFRTKFTTTTKNEKMLQFLSQLIFVKSTFRSCT